MTSQRLIKITGMALFLFLACGCTIFTKSPIDKNYYDLTINTPANSDKHMGIGAMILVREFHIATAFDSHSFILRVKNDEYINDYYNEFVSYPAKLITEKFTEHLCASRHFTSVQTATRKDIDYRLSGKIMQIYGDFRKTAEPKAIIRLRILLEKKSEDAFAVEISKTYEVDIPIESERSTDLVSGWSRGLLTIIQQFLTEFNQASE